MDSDTRAFVLACTVCACSKSSHQSSTGLLCPLVIPRRPWSHIGLDFVTGLPPSMGKTTILTIVDRFSKLYILCPYSYGDCRPGEQHRFRPYHIHRYELFIVLFGASVSFSSTDRAGQPGPRRSDSICKNLESLSLVWSLDRVRTQLFVKCCYRVVTFECSLGFQPPVFPVHEDEIAVPSVQAHLRW